MNNELQVTQTVCSFKNLYKALYKCKQNVGWKDSVAGFVKNGLVNCMKLREQLYSGKYKINEYTIFYIYEPKERKIVSTRIKDRVFQRSLCDNYLTAEVSRSFVYDNCACQKNKGTMFARNRLKCHLQRYFREHGLNGYVLKCDITNYFGNTRHDVAIAAIRKRTRDDWAFSEVVRIIQSFGDGEDADVGMGLGSQVTQLIELAVLDDLDHFIKEKLHIKQYIRYMDDFILIHESKEYLAECKRQIGEKLEALSLNLSKKKTQIFPITQPIKFLGFSFWLTDTGKVIMKLFPNKISHERRKLKKLVQRSKAGILTRKQVDACFESWKAHAEQGNSYKLVQNMTKFYHELWRA